MKKKIEKRGIEIEGGSSGVWKSVLFFFGGGGRFGPKRTASIWGCKAFLGCTGCMHWLHLFSAINSSVEGILLFGRLVKIPALMILTVVLTCFAGGHRPSL